MLPPLTTARRSAAHDEGAAGVTRLKSLQARATGSPATRRRAPYSRITHARSVVAGASQARRGRQCGGQQ